MAKLNENCARLDTQNSYGTYGPAFEEGANAFPTPADIPLDNFYSCGDCVFPGVGVPAVAVSGVNVANSCVSPLKHLRLINRMEKKDVSH